MKPITDPKVKQEIEEMRQRAQKRLNERPNFTYTPKGYGKNIKFTYQADRVWWFYTLIRFVEVTIGAGTDYMDIVSIQKDDQPRFYWTRRGLDKAIDQWIRPGVRE